MKMAIAIITSIIIGFAVGRITHNMNNNVVRLTKPLYAMSSDNLKSCTLPIGTKLFHVKALPEGGDIFKVYFYYKGAPLVTKPAEHRWDMEAITVYFEEIKSNH